MAFQCQGCDKTFLFAFIFFLNFHEASEKLETERNLALILFLTFHEASEKTGNWKKSFMVFNAQAVIQHFLLTLILIVTFHEASEKMETGRNL